MVISQQRPAFVTVLNAAKVPQDDWERSEFLKLAYAGPLYFDFDLDTNDEDGLSKTTDSFKLFLVRLQEEFQVNLNCLKLFATGGRGYHIEVPMRVFMSKVPPTGVAMLPLVYREMALDLAIETLDLAIYSTRKGRMWRVPNLERANGRYKVPISVHEALHMDGETYLRLTSAPRHYRGDPEAMKDSPWLYDTNGELPPPVESELALPLQSMFVEKRDQVDNQLRKQAKVKDERASLNKYKGQMPESILTLMRGERLRDDLGFNTVALQLAIVGAAFGLSADDFMAKCEGFVKTHSGDGSRYNSPRKRGEALRERYIYVQESPIYVFSQAGLRSICAVDYSPADLFGGLTFQDAPRFDPNADPHADPMESVPEDLRASIELAERSDTTDGILMLKMGIFQRKGESGVMAKLSDISFQSPAVQVDLHSHRVTGYSAVIVVTKPGVSPKNYGRVNVPANVFNSRATLDGFCQTYSSFYKGNDVGATVIRNIINTTAIKEKDMEYVLTREGMDIIRNPEGDETMTVWATMDQVITQEDMECVEDKTMPKLVCRPRWGANRVSTTDVHLQPIPERTPEFKEWFEQMLKVNRPAVVANSLGWFVSCYHRQHHHRCHGQFPTLYMYGSAGSGKTTTPHLFMYLFSTHPPDSWSQLSKGTTGFATQYLFSRSTTVPAVIDEFRRDAFYDIEYNKYIAEIRLAYNQTAYEKGGGSDGSARSDWTDVTMTARSTPLVFISEEMLEDPAARERLVPVALSRSSQNEAAWATAYAEKNRHYMTQIGSLLLRRTLAMSYEEFDERFRRTMHQVRECRTKLTVRQQANLAVVTMGLQFLGESLKAGLGLDVTEQIDVLAQAAYGEMMQEHDIAPIIPVEYKALQDISYITWQEVTNPATAIRETHEYIVDEGFIDMDMHGTYRRYLAFSKANNLPMKLTTYEAFLSSMAKVDGLVDTLCPDSKLRRWAATTIFRFDLSKLGQRGVEPFATSAAK